MPCACQGGKSANRVWVFTGKDGTTKEYTSEIQARAAVVRAGGGKVTPRDR
jgi:hypothetical protein